MLTAACAVVATPAHSSLIHHYEFFAGVTDSGSVPISGTLAGSGGSGLPTATGGVLTLDGVDDFVSFGPDTYLVPIAPSFGSLNFTVMLFAKFSSNGTQDFYSQGGGGHALYMGPNGIEMRVTDNYHFWTTVDSPVNGGGCGSGSDNCTGVATPSDGEWHNYALTASGSDAAFYIDGVLKATRSGFILSDGGVATVLGRQFNSSEYFGGSLSDVRIYDIALAGSEVFEIATGLSAAPEPQSALLLFGALIATVSVARRRRRGHAASAYPKN